MAGKENISRLWTTQHSHQGAPGSVSKSRTALGNAGPTTTPLRVGAKRVGSTDRSGRGHGLSVLMDRNGASAAVGHGRSPRTAKRSRTEDSATIISGIKKSSTAAVDATPFSSSMYDPPMRVRVDNSSARSDISLSFWSVAAPSEKSSFAAGVAGNKPSTVVSKAAAAGPNAAEEGRGSSRGLPQQEIKHQHDRHLPENHSRMRPKTNASFAVSSKQLAEKGVIDKVAAATPTSVRKRTRVEAATTASSRAREPPPRTSLTAAPATRGSVGPLSAAMESSSATSNMTLSSPERRTPGSPTPILVAGSSKSVVHAQRNTSAVRSITPPSAVSTTNITGSDNKTSPHAPTRVRTTVAFAKAEGDARGDETAKGGNGALGPIQGPPARRDARLAPPSFGADISHILKWQPAPRPKGSGDAYDEERKDASKGESVGRDEMVATSPSGSSGSSGNNVLARANRPAAAASASVREDKSSDARQVGIGPEPRTHNSRSSSVAPSNHPHSRVDGVHAPTRLAREGAGIGMAEESGARSKVIGGTAAGVVGPAEAGGSSSRAAELLQSRPKTAVGTTVRPGISASLGAVRVRVTGKENLDGDDDGEDDSFDASKSLEVSIDSSRRRSADTPSNSGLLARAGTAPPLRTTAVTPSTLSKSGSLKEDPVLAPTRMETSSNEIARRKAAQISPRKTALVAGTRRVAPAAISRDNGSFQRGNDDVRTGGGPSAKRGVAEAPPSMGGWPRGSSVMMGDDSAAAGEEDPSLTIAAGQGMSSLVAATSAGNVGVSGLRSSKHVIADRRGAPLAEPSREDANANRTNSPSLGSERTDASDPASGSSHGSIGGQAEGGASRSSGLLGGNTSLGVGGGFGKRDDEAVALSHAPSTIGSEIVVNGTRYLKTAKIGRGGSSEVFRVVAPDGQMLALKIVKVDPHGEQAQFLLDSYANEIALLEKLKGNRFIIQLEDAEVDRNRGIISILLELGETDLDRLLRQHKLDMANHRAAPTAAGESDLFPGGLEANFVRVIWQQMLKVVQAMHEERVVHGDLKPANFVFVRGCLKLIDFGIAKAISNDTTNISRDSRLGTMNYMCPEAFEDTGRGDVDPDTGRQTPVIKLGRASDIWSLGCILYQMTHGRTPFSHLGMLQKMRAITNRDHAIQIADLKDISLLETLRGCLERDPDARAPIGGPGGLLSHAYLHPVAAIASIEEDLVRRSERHIAEELDKRLALAVGKAVAAEQSRQAAGRSIAKSAVKQIIGETIRVLRAEEALQQRGGLDRVTAMVMGHDRVTEHHRQ